MPSTVPKQAPRLPKPAARYWKGKIPKGVAQVDSDSEDEESPVEEQEQNDVPFSGDQEIKDDQDEPEDISLRQEIAKPSKSINIALKDVDIRDGKVIVAGREESGRTAVEDEGSARSQRLRTLLNSYRI